MIEVLGVGAGAITLAVVALVLALRRRPTDPGPWSWDGRIPATKCQWRSVDSGGLCTRRARHRGRHDRPPVNPDAHLAGPAVRTTF